MKRHFNLQKGYRCGECGADVEAAGGPDFMVAWRCRNCDWGTVQDTYDPDLPESVEKHNRGEQYD